jgi:hypothetical protein
MSATMHAIRQQVFGGPEVLELTEVKRPVPVPTEVLVRVRAAGVNPVEAVIRSAQFPLLGQPPFILGWDVSGWLRVSSHPTMIFRPNRRRVRPPRKGMPRRSSPAWAATEN